MSQDELSTALSGHATRRAIIKTGSRIAYSAPLVAATLKIGTGGAAAIPVVSPGSCTPDGVGCASTAECCENLFCNCTSFVCTQYGVLGTDACCTESRQCLAPLICGSNNLCCHPDFPGQPGGCPI
jgi:hypothetical protein